MPQNGHVIAAILETTVQTAQRRGASKELVALGIIAALRRIHAAVEEASEAMALGVRATILNLITARNLERLRGTKTTPVPAPLPEAGSSQDWAVIALFEDAANSCLALNAFMAGNDAIDQAILLLTERLIAVLGAPPDYAKLIDRIAGSTGGPIALALLQGTSAALN